MSNFKFTVKVNPVIKCLDLSHLNRTSKMIIQIFCYFIENITVDA